MTLRDYHSNDFEIIRHWIADARFLLQWAGPGFTYPLTAEQFFKLESEDRIHAYALEQDQTVLGYGEVVMTGSNQGLICRVIVDGSMRGTGVGKQLAMKLVERAFKDLALDKLTLNVFDFNESAIRCYQSVGFKETKRVEAARQFDGEDWTLVVMELHNPNLSA